MVPSSSMGASVVGCLSLRISEHFAFAKSPFSSRSLISFVHSPFGQQMLMKGSSLLMTPKVNVDSLCLHLIRSVSRLTKYDPIFSILCFHVNHYPAGCLWRCDYNVWILYSFEICGFLIQSTLSLDLHKNI